MALLPRGGNGTGGAGGGDCCCGEKEININMDCGSCGGGGSGGGGSAFDDAPGDGKLYGRKNGAWAEVETNPAPVSEHNGLDGLQGGDAAAHEFFHLTEAEWRRLPIRPEIVSPADGTEGINQVPQVVGSPYAHPYDVPMRAKHIQVSVSGFFDDLAYESEEFSGSPVFQIPLKPDETPYLAEGEWYHVRIRYQDRMGRWSEWSEESRFKTMDVFPAGVLLTPVMVLPADGGEARAVDPILAMSAPKVAAGVANFDGADWQISNNSAFETTLYEATGTANLTMHAASGVNLASALGAEFWARGRQRTDAGEYTPWAVPSRFTLRPDYADPVFGMRRIFSKKYNAPIVWQIDPEGSPVHIPKSYFDKHPLYAFPVENILVGDIRTNEGEPLVSQMAFVPPCWIKHSVYDNEDGDMVIDLWFSATPQTGDGWILHPAFSRAQDGLYVDTCLCAAKTAADNLAYFVSDAGTAPSYTNNSSAVINRTLAAAPGRRVWNIYERRLLLDLMVCESQTMDPARISVAAEPHNMNTRFAWRSFYGLVTQGYSGGGGTFQACDGVTLAARVDNVIRNLSLLHPNGSMLQMEVSLTPGTGSPARVLRGMADVFGFDAALLGIAAGLEAAVDKRHFGTTRQVTLDRDSGSFYATYEPMPLGLYAFLPYNNLNKMYVALRMSRAAGI